MISSFAWRGLSAAVFAVSLAGCATQTGHAEAKGAAAANAATTSDSLAQTSWTLDSWVAADGRTVRHQPVSSDGRPVHLDFLARGDSYRVAGFSGCNSYMGTYKLAKGMLTVTAPASTRMACASPQDAALEKDFLQALGTISTFTLDSGGAPRKMTITLSSGDTLAFTRGDDPSAKS